MAVIASCAFFSFAAETIFIADVICIVDETEVHYVFPLNLPFYL
jgi:hypothetical protein